MSGVRPGFSLRNFFNTLTTKQSILIIAVLGILVFFNSLPNNYVGDDTSQIVNNKPVHSVTNVLSFFTGSTFYSGGAEKPIGVYFRPLPITVFSFLYTIFGPNAYPFHLFQIFLHILNACVLFLFLKHFFKKPISLFLSLIFLVHPINSEAVFYISATQEVLFFFFGITALWILANVQSPRYLVLVGLSLLLSLLSKETGMLFLFLSIAYSFIFSKKRFYPLLGTSVALIIPYLLLRTNAVGILTKSLSSPISSLTFSERLINMPAILFYYLKTFVFPLNLAFSQHWVYSEVTLNNFFLPLLADLLFLAAIFFFGAVLYKKYPYKYFKIYTFFCVWFLSGIIPHLQIFPLDATVAERWFYLSMVGILGMIGVLLSVFRFNVLNRWALSISLLILVLLSARTFIRSFDWRDDLTLATHDNKVSKSYALENMIGNELGKRGQLEEAVVHIQKSIQLYPYVTNYNNLGVMYLRLGDYQKAKEAYIKGLQFGDYYLLYENLGGLALIYGNADENISFLTSALKKFPQNARLWLFLAILEYTNGSIQSAKDAINKAYYYDQDANTGFVYNKIMSGQELKLEFKVVGN